MQNNKDWDLLFLKIIQFNRGLLLSMLLESNQKGRGAHNQLRYAAESSNRRKKNNNKVITCFQDYKSTMYLIIKII